MDRWNGTGACARARIAASCAAAILAIYAPGADAFALSGAAAPRAMTDQPAGTVVLSGAVLDGAGATVTDASVTVVDTATNQSRQTVTGATGVYTFSLSPGRYELHVIKPGFALAVRSGVQVNQTTQVDIVLQVDTITESVQVSAASPLLNTTTGAVSTTFEREILERAPLSGHNFNALIQTTAGVVMTATSEGNPGTFSANGQRPNANYYTVDGVSANFAATAAVGGYGGSAGQFAAADAVGGTMGIASVDAVEELTIQTSSFAPEYGRQPGAQVQIRTRGGSNVFHGSAFEYFRRDRFDAADWFNNYRGLAKNPLQSDNFGGTFGGPLRKNRLFFFASHESLRANITNSSAIEVPTAEARALAHPAIRPYLDGYPLPNGAPLKQLSGEFISQWEDYINSDSTSVRVDGRLLDTMTVFGRYQRAPSHTLIRNSGRIMSPGTTRSSSDAVTVGTTMTHSSSLVTDVRVNWGRSRAGSGWLWDGYGGAVAPPAEFTPATKTGFGVFYFGNSWYNNGSIFADNIQRQINAVGTVTWHRGSHSLKLGADYRRLSPTADGSDLYVSATFPSDNLGALQSGIPPSGISYQGGITRETRTHNLSLYAQDAWRPTSNVTLTYGVRWEFNPAETSRDDRPIFALASANSPAEMVPAEPGSPYYKNTFTSFGPRVGLAWSLDQRTVVRSALGVFHDLTSGGAGGAGWYALKFPYTSLGTVRDIQYPPTDPRFLTEIPPPSPMPYQEIWSADPNLKPPYSIQWNVAIERELPGQQVATVSYVSSDGRRQPLQDTLKNPNPYFANLHIMRNVAESSYRSVQLQYRKRWSDSFQAMASYTWGHAIDERSTDTGVGFPSDLDIVDTGDPRGNASYDVRHTFNANVGYQVPAVASGWLGALVNEWGLNLLVRARSGSPIDILATRNLGNGTNSFRVDYLGGPYWIDDASVPGGKRLNPAAFAIPAELRQGNLGRNVVYGFGMWQPDLSLTKRFRVSGGVGLELRIESFNFINKANFANPVTTVGAATFGVSQNTFARQATGTVGTAAPAVPAIFQVGGPRSHQIALKIIF